MMLTTASAPIIDVVCATYNGVRHLSAFMESLRAQEDAAWRVWFRDDGSDDGTRELLDEFASTDARVQVIEDHQGRLGVTHSFGALLQHVASSAEYVMCADQDDVWMPHKMRISMARMREAEGRKPSPVLVHTDLRVVDGELRPVADSFWALTHLRPEPATVRRVVLQGLVTGATVLVNRALLERALPVPAEAVMHDWWLAAVAVSCGVVEAIHEPTVLYRQHGANVVGAARPAWEGAWHRLPQRVGTAITRRGAARRSIDETALQAGALDARVGPVMTAEDHRFVTAYSRIPTLGVLARKFSILRWRCRAEYGVLRNLGMMVRG